MSRQTLAQYSSVNGNTATLVVPSWACPVKVSFSSYSLPSGEVLPFEEQVLIDNVTATYGPGTHHLTLDTPDCAYQTDLYLGEVIYPLTAGAHHNHHGTNYLIKYDIVNEGQVCEPPPPPGEVCDEAEDGCLKVALLEVVTNADGTTTYNVRITYNCHKGLSYAALELPDGVQAVSYSTGWPIVDVDNPGGTGGWHNPNFRNIKFEFGGDIKNGDSVELSYTLPAGASYSDGLRVQTKGGWYKHKVTLDPSECTPPPPPGEVCDEAEDGCLKVALLEVVTNADGTTTYNVRITYNCHKDLYKAFVELPDGVEAVSYSTGFPIVNVYNPGGTGGWFNPDFNNIKFVFGGDIDDGESVELSYTLPAGASYSDGLRVRTWGGWHTQQVTLDPEACVDVCELDQGPPVIAYSFDEDEDGSYIVVDITDDTGIASVDIDLQDTQGGPVNLELIEEDFTPGAMAATFRYRLINFTQNTYVRVVATDLCQQTQCPDTDQFPTTPPAVVINGQGNSATGYAFHPDGLASLEFFRLINVEVTANTFVPEIVQADFTLEAVTQGEPTRYGMIAASACNATVIDPDLYYSGNGARGATGLGSIEVGMSAFDTTAKSEGALSGTDEAVLPTEFAVGQNYPNPFSTATSIEVELPEPSEVRVEVYNLLGQRVRTLGNGSYEAGKHVFRFDADGLVSGTYIYRVVTPEKSITRRMVLVN